MLTIPLSQIQYLLFERTRLTRALQQLYRQTLSGEPWRGDPVTELPSDGPSIHEILQRLEGDNLAESGMGIIATKEEQSPLWLESQESSILDTVLPRISDDSTRDATTKAEANFSPSSTQVTIPTPMPTHVVDVPFSGFNSSSAMFSTTGFPTAGFCTSSLPSDGSPTCFVNPSGDVYFPPWTLYAQPIDDSTPPESSRIRRLHLP
jgi:hypothetical protein